MPVHGSSLLVSLAALAIAGCAASPVVEQDALETESDERERMRDAAASTDDEGEGEDEGDRDARDDTGAVETDDDAPDDDTADEAATDDTADDDTADDDATDGDGPSPPRADASSTAAPRDAGAPDAARASGSATTAPQRRDAGQAPAAARDAGRASTPSSGEGCRSGADCQNSCLPVGIAPCCRANRTCGCTWAPGAYCL